jgi:RNA polymerase sigma-70 factor (ECF subfamily)
MARGELERLFERFRDHGDLAALAQVFDRTAPQLLSVARHLASAEAAAEDLVQATFVAAIEHAQRFESSRELVPWLTGILTNKAKLARALGAREADVGRLEQRGERDPALDAELHEFVATLERALERVPSQYRDVLRKHLGDGKKPEQIARELGREQGTVRVQLHRALAHLRRVLPPGFALGAAVWLGAPRGLAAVRSNVLRHARVSLAGSGSIVLGGWIVSTKASVIVGVIVVALLGLWQWTRSEPAMPTSLAVASPSAPAPSANPTRAVEDASESRIALETVAAPAAVQSSPASDRGALDIEVVWYDGTPAPGIALEVTPLGERQPNQHRRSVRTDALGRASVDGLMQGAVQIRDDHRQPEARPSAAHVTANAHEQTHLVLYRGFDLSGSILDVHHAPVAGAIVWFCGYDSQPHAREVARSDADGHFFVKSLCGEARIFATADGHGTSAALRFGEHLMNDPLPIGKYSEPPAAGHADVEHKTVTEIELVLDDSRCVVHGVVRDPDGALIPGAHVQWIAVNTNSDDGTRVLQQPALPQETDANGEFRIGGLRRMWGRVAVCAEGFAMWTSPHTKLIESDVNEFDVHLERGASVAGTVRDGLGTVLPNVRFAEVRADGGRFVCADFNDLSTLSDAEGRFQLDGIASGSFRLEASATLEGFEQRVSVDLQAASGQTLEWNAHFATGQSIFGRALDPQSAPLVGWGIYARPMSSRSFGGEPTTKTDASGRFEIKALVGETYRVQLHPPDEAFYWLAELVDVAPGGNQIAFVGDPDDLRSVFLHGRVVDSNGAPFLTRIFATQATANGGPMATQNADGTFSVGPLQRGETKLSVELTLGHNLDHVITNLVAHEDRDVGDIVVP